MTEQGADTRVGDVLSRARALVASLTHLPWSSGPNLDNCGGGRSIVSAGADSGVYIAHTVRVCYAGEEVISEGQAKVHAEFIAAAPQLVRDLIAEVERWSPQRRNGEEFSGMVRQWLEDGQAVSAPRLPLVGEAEAVDTSNVSRGEEA